MTGCRAEYKHRVLSLSGPILFFIM